MFKRGVKVFRLNQDGRDYFDLHHTADDTFDKIDRDAFQQNVAAWATLLYFFAQQPELPQS
jgi:carboxypeptidase Q